MAENKYPYIAEYVGGAGRNVELVIFFSEDSNIVLCSKYGNSGKMLHIGEQAYAKYTGKYIDFVTKLRNLCSIEEINENS
jgi:hypothetical protein